MLRNYLTVAFRNLIKSRLYSAINILGLAVALASCIAIILYVRDELSYDRWIPDAERIYRVHVRYDMPGRAPLQTTSSSALTLAALQKDFPQQIETGVRVMTATPTIQREGEVFFERGAFVDTSFFDVFDLPLIAGDKATALQDASAIAVSETFARKYFGEANPIGQTLSLRSPQVNREVRVAAVYKDLPSNTHLIGPNGTYDFFAPLIEQDYAAMAFILNQWTSQNLFTYFKLRPGQDVTAISTTMEAFLARNASEDQRRDMTLSVMALPDLHLNAVSGNSAAAANSRQLAVTAFSLIAALILGIASINFTNLATARALRRAREVGLRKVLGAHRSQLIAQFVGESLLVAGIALVLATILVEVLLPVINQFLGKTLSVTYFGSGSVLPYLLGLVAVVGVIGGTYPAFYLSRFEAAQILKPGLSRMGTRASMRQILVVVQFAISIALIVCTVVVHRQVNHVKSMDVGFRKEGVMVIRGAQRAEVKAVLETLQQELERIPGVMSTSFSGPVPTDGSNQETGVRRPGDPNERGIPINIKVIDYDFLDVYQVPLLAGRGLERDRAGDDFTGTAQERVERGGNILVNLKAVQRFGFASPEAALNQPLEAFVGNNMRATATIVGVVADVQYRSARDELPPTILFLDQGQFQNISVRYGGMTEAEARAAIQAVWRQVVPAVPFRGEFMTDLVDNLYRAEAAQAAMFTAFSVLAVLVACLGLFGLAAFTAERRTKEIGLRKVVGARVGDIVRLLVWQFSKPVAVANLIAWPVAYFIMRDWLDGFLFRIGLSPLIFIGAGVMALLIAWVTISTHAVRVALANPIHALRYE